MNFQEYIKFITNQTDLSSQEAIWLLEHIAQSSHAALLLSNPVLSRDQHQHLVEVIHEMVHNHKPLGYIIGWVPFLSTKLLIQPPILIPRPETEEWLHELIQELQPQKHQILRILDIGTGSASIGINLALSFPQSQILALDVNQAAIDLAQKNATLNNATNITFMKSDVFSALKNHAPFDLIVSNPPYIPSVEYETLTSSVRLWEDPNALISGPTGTNVLQIILEQANSYVKPNSALPYQLVLEIDRSQHQAIQELAHHYGWDCQVTKDQFGNWRTAWCKQQKSPL